MFIESLGKALKAQGVKVKIKQLCQYFDFIKKVCPWFPAEGAIHTKRWKRVGDAIKDFYEAFGPEKVPVNAFFYWGLIDEILSQRHTNPIVASVVHKGENILKGKTESKKTKEEG